MDLKKTLDSLNFEDFGQKNIIFIETETSLLAFQFIIQNQTLDINFSFKLK